MIEKTIRYLCAEINQYIQVPGDFVKLGNIAQLNEPGTDFGTKVIATVVNIEEEKTLKNGPFYVQQGDSMVKRNPTIFLNLYVLFSCADINYYEAVGKVSKILHFFQRKSVFLKENADVPALYPDEGVERIIMEMFSINFEQINHLWGILGGKYYPSVLYKLRLVQVQNAPAEEVAVVKEIKTSENSN